MFSWRGPRSRPLQSQGQLQVGTVGTCTYGSGWVCVSMGTVERLPFQISSLLMILNYICCFALTTQIETCIVY